MTSLIENLNNFLTENSPSWSINTFYCSSLSDCSRKLYYDRLNIKKDSEQSPLIKRRLDKGSYIHEMFQNYFEKSGILVSKEEYIKDNKLQIAGKIDCIVEIENTTYIVEIKTSDSKDNVNKFPYISHLWQLQMYLHNKGLKNGKLFYVFLDKNMDKIDLPLKDYTWYSDKDLLEIDIIYNSDVIRQIETKLEKIIYNLSIKTPPGKEPDKCQFCYYKNYCNVEDTQNYDLKNIFENFLLT